MVSSPAGSRTRFVPRDTPGAPAGHFPTAVQVIGHAGLAIHNAEGSPARRHLDEAMSLGVDRIELDVCCTADGRLVMRHDVSLVDGRSVADLTLSELRVADSGVLTIDDAVEHLGEIGRAHV